ncbi:ester cyclase [Devosia naphthalenivorans]|uniref:ester cyclase n=1 Tax=Devosia naphthalenivorans TaxID=2082392 RepID=UPI000D3CA286|nr:ester cyclase [Devosia naphthalenivorans]
MLKPVDQFFLALNSGDKQIIGNLVTGGAIFSLPYGSEDPLKGVNQFIDELFVFEDAFPDAKYKLRTCVANDDMHIAAFTITGHHRNNFMGEPATGKKHRFYGAAVFKLEGDKYSEVTMQFGISELLGCD